MNIIDIRIVAKNLDNLPGLYITCQEILDIESGIKYLRYDLCDNDPNEPLISNNTPFIGKISQTQDTNIVRRVLFEFQQKSIYLLRNVDEEMLKTLKAYKDTVKSIDNLP